MRGQTLLVEQLIVSLSLLCIINSSQPDPHTSLSLLSFKHLPRIIVSISNTRYHVIAYENSAYRSYRVHW